MIIYKAVNKLNGNTYIGKTILSLHQRKTGHLNYVNNQNSETYFHRALRKHGIDNFEWSIIQTCITENHLNLAEQAYIELYKMNGVKLYNMTEGGEGVRLCGEKNGFYGKKHSEETRDHWSEIRKGKNTGEQNANYQGKYSKGENNGFFGKNHTEETKSKVGKHHINQNYGLTGESHPMFGKTGKNHPQSKAVFQINKDTNEIIKEWESMTSAEKELKIRHISECCRGKLKISGGFKWAYVKNYPLE